MIIVLLVFTMLVSYHYSANLTSNLAIKKDPPLFDGLMDIYNSKTHKILLREGTSQLFWLKNSKNLVERRIWRDMIENCDDCFITTREEGFERIMNEKAVLVIWKNVVNKYNRKKCNYVILKEKHPEDWISFGLQKYSPYRELFNRILLRLKENGVMNRIYGSMELDQNMCNEKSNVLEPINITQVASIMNCFVLAVIFSLIVLGLEYLQFSRR